MTGLPPLWKCLGPLAARWLNDPSRPVVLSPARAGLGRRRDDAAAGGSIRAMQGVLDEIARFEQE